MERLIEIDSLNISRDAKRDIILEEYPELKKSFDFRLEYYNERPLWICLLSTSYGKEICSDLSLETMIVIAIRENSIGIFTLIYEKSENKMDTFQYLSGKLCHVIHLHREFLLESIKEDNSDIYKSIIKLDTDDIAFHISSVMDDAFRYKNENIIRWILSSSKDMKNDFNSVIFSCIREDINRNLFLLRIILPLTGFTIVDVINHLNYASIQKIQTMYLAGATFEQLKKVRYDDDNKFGEWLTITDI